MKESKILVTVVICTWNRCELLKQCLEQMTKLVIPQDVEWELLVVNNNCTDVTDQIIASFSNRLPIRRLFESKQGQSYARNSAVRTSMGELILWTDDDALVDPNWLAAYVKASEAWPDAMFFGGEVLPFFETPPPKWIQSHLDKLKGVYVICQLGDRSKVYSSTEGLSGVNMAIRREVFRHISFNESLGRCGSNHVRNDDTEFNHRMKIEGYKGVCIATAKVRHYIPTERLTKKYIWEWFHGAGRTYVREGRFGSDKCLFGAPRWAFKKYFEARIKSVLFEPLKDARWFGAFRDVAIWKGVIDESLSQNQKGHIL